MNCNYKVKLDDIQNKYKFNIFCTGSYNDSDLRKMIESVYYALPRTTGTGTSVTLNDTAFSYIKNKLYATETSQDTLTGKNLLKTSLAIMKASNNAGTWNNNVYTFRGVTFTINEDLSIKINGTATGGRADLYLFGGSSDTGNYMYIPQGTYTFDRANLVDGTLFYAFREKTVGTKYETNTADSAVVLMGTQDCYFYGVMIGLEAGKTANNLTLYPMLVSGSTLGDYETYCGGIPAPNPSYPMLIHTITGNNKIISSNSDNSLSNSVLLTLGDTEICKKDDYEDKIFKAIKGNEIYDSLTTEEQATLDYGSWYLRKEFISVVVNSATSGNVSSYTPSGTGKVEKWQYSYRVLNPNTNLYGIGAYGYTRVLADKFTRVSQPDEFNENTGICLSAYGHNDWFEIRFRVPVTYTKQEAIDFINGTKVYYPCSTLYIKFNSTIQDQLEDIYNNMLSYEGQTNISQENADLPFNINSTAIKDLNNL